MANHFLEIGWLEFEIISRWSLGSSQAIVQSINRETALTVSEADIKRTGLFLESQQVLLDDPQTLLRKSRLAARKKIRQRAQVPGVPLPLLPRPHPAAGCLSRQHPEIGRAHV